MSLLERLMGGPQRLVPPPEPDLPPELLPFRRCRACEVQWRGGPVCWCCGKAGR